VPRLALVLLANAHKTFHTSCDVVGAAVWHAKGGLQVRPPPLARTDCGQRLYSAGAKRVSREIAEG
jgi:hypothetical protein